MRIDSPRIVNDQATAFVKKQESAQASENQKSLLTAKKIKKIALVILCVASAAGLAILLKSVYDIKIEGNKRLQEENLAKKEYDSCLNQCKPVKTCLNEFTPPPFFRRGTDEQIQKENDLIFKTLEDCVGCRGLCSEKLLKDIKVI